MATPAAAEKLLTAAGIVLLSVSACAYGLSGSLPSHLQTVRVSPFRSSVTEYGLEQELTAMVTERLVLDGRLAVVTEEPDCMLEGSVVAWNRTPYSYTSAEQVEEYRLEIRTEIAFTDLVEETGILERESVTTWIVYDPSGESEQDARQRLLTQAAEDMVSRCLSGW